MLLSNHFPNRKDIKKSSKSSKCKANLSDKTLVLNHDIFINKILTCSILKTGQIKSVVKELSMPLHKTWCLTTQRKVQIDELFLFNNNFVYLKVRFSLSVWFSLACYILSLTLKLIKQWNMVNFGSKFRNLFRTSQTSNMHVLAKMVNSVYFLTVFVKSSILDVGQDSVFVS